MMTDKNNSMDYLNCKCKYWKWWHIINNKIIEAFWWCSTLDILKRDRCKHKFWIWCVHFKEEFQFPKTNSNYQLLSLYFGGPSTPDWVMRSAIFFSKSSIRFPISSILVRTWSEIAWNLSCICWSNNSTWIEEYRLIRKQ